VQPLSNCFRLLFSVCVQLSATVKFAHVLFYYTVLVISSSAFDCLDRLISVCQVGRKTVLISLNSFILLR